MADFVGIGNRRNQRQALIVAVLGVVLLCCVCGTQAAPLVADNDIGGGRGYYCMVDTPVLGGRSTQNYANDVGANDRQIALDQSNIKETAVNLATRFYEVGQEKSYGRSALGSYNRLTADSGAWLVDTKCNRLATANGAKGCAVGDSVTTTVAAEGQSGRPAPIGDVDTAGVAPVASMQSIDERTVATTNDIGGSSLLVMEQTTGRVLASANAHAQLPMASTTKILTAITVLQHVDLNKEVMIDPQAEGVEGSSIYLRRGEKWTVRDLLYGLMLRSGNDAAVQLAITAGGTVERFVDYMNHTAYQAGAFKSHFCNPHGLHDDDHYTTAYDLACITRFAMANEDFARIVATKRYTYTGPDGEQHVFVNKNKMLTGYPGATGVKTGYTRKAGRCLVSSANRDGMQLICVALNIYDMWQQSAKAMDGAFAQYTMTTLMRAGERYPVRWKDSMIDVTVRNDVAYPLAQNELSGITYRYSLLSRQGADGHVGDVILAQDDRVLYCEPIYRILQ